MKKITFLVFALSFMLTGMAFAANGEVDYPDITTWTVSVGVGGGGPGIGDALLSPLYDVRTITDSNLPAPYNTANQEQFTMFSLVNTDRVYGVFAVLRFREWKRSREVLDIDILLTTNDVWVGEVYRLAGGGAALRSPDRYMNAAPSPSLMNDCIPTSVINAVDFGLGVGNGIPFRTYDLESGLTTAEQNARMEYGYFEIIAMENVLAPTAAWCFPRVGNWQSGLPPIPWLGRNVRNVLFGTTFIIRPDQAISHQFNMTALGNFSVNTDGIFDFNTTTGATVTTLLRHVQGEGQQPGVGGFDQLEFALSKRYIRFQYVCGWDELNTPMSTSVVATFPTKHFHYDSTFHLRTASYPWNWPFTGTHEVLGDGDPYGEIFWYYIYDRSENTFSTPTLPPISPPPPTSPSIPRLPWEVNIIGMYPAVTLPTAYFRNNVLISTGTSTTTPFEAGYAWLDLSPAYLGTGDTRTYHQGEHWLETTNGPPNNLQWLFNFFNFTFTFYRGLPTIGIVMTEFYNDTVNGYYGNTVPWNFNVYWTNTARPAFPDI